MKTNVFILYLFTVLTLYGVVQAVWTPQLEDAKDLEADAVSTLEELRLIHETAIQEAKDALEEVLTDTRFLADSVKIYGFERLQAEADNVATEIQRIEDEANQLGVDVTECTVDQAVAVNELPSSIGAELELCVSTQVNEAVRIVKSALVIIEETIGAIGVFEEDIETCNGDEICLTNLISEINSAKTSIPEEINGIAFGINAFVESIQPKIEACADQKISQIISQANIILAEVVQCINDLLKQQ